MSDREGWHVHWEPFSKYKGLVSTRLSSLASGKEPFNVIFPFHHG